MAKRSSYKTGLSVIQVDEETGEMLKQTITTEVIEGFRDVKLPERHKFKSGPFITLFQNSMKLIAQNGKKNFTKDELVILIFLLGTAGLGNSIVVDYPLLSEELNIQRTHCVTAIKSLILKGIIIKQKEYRADRNTPKEMQLSVNFDQLNYNLAYNGKIKDHSTLKFVHPDLELEEKNKKQLDIFKTIPLDEDKLGL